MKLKITFIAALSFFSSVVYLARAINQELDGGKVVQIHTSKHRARRDVRSLTFKIDDINYSFNFELSKRDVFSRDIPIWIVKSKPGSSPNYTYELVPDTQRILSNGHIYVDNAMKAVTFVHYDENNTDILYDGLFGENDNVHLIKSLSETQQKRLQRLQQPGNHVIHKTQRKITALFKNKKDRSKRAINPLKEKLEKPLDVLYPKLLILVDYHLFKHFNNDISETIKYVVTFWNAVDQKYTEIDTPKVQIVVTGIIIADDETAFNYVYQSRYESKESDRKASPDKMFEKMRMYFHYNFSTDVDFRNYDAAALMTALDTSPTAGLSFYGKICGDWYNEIIVRDYGRFDGIHVATHELGHSFGAQHDSYGTSGKCQSHDNNRGVSVMSPVGDSGDYFFWSNCTKDYIHEFSTLKAAECLATRSRRRYYDEDNLW